MAKNIDGSKDKGEVFVDIDLDPNGNLALEYKIRCGKLMSDGPGMNDEGVRNAINYIKNVFPSDARVKAGSDALKNESKLISYMQVGLFHALFKGIKENVAVADALKMEVFNCSRRPKNGKRADFMGKIAEELVEVIDPLLVDPLVPGDFRDVKFENLAQNVDQEAADFYKDLFAGREGFVKKELSPSQILALSFMHVHFFEPIKFNIDNLLDTTQGDKGITSVFIESAQREANLMIYDLGTMVMDKIILAKDFDIHELGSIVKTTVELIEGYKNSLIPLLIKLSPRRAVLEVVARIFGFGVDLRLGLPEEEENEGRFESVVTSMIDLSGDATVFLRMVEKRSIEEIAKNRPDDPEKFQRLKLLVQFILLMKEKLPADKVSTAAFNFTLSMLSRLKDDDELAELGVALKPVINYLFTIPGGFREVAFENPKLIKFINANPAIFPQMMDFFLPQKPALTEAKAARFNKKYGIIFEVLNYVNRNRGVHIEDEQRYMIAFTLENVKSFFETEKEMDFFVVLAMINALLKPYRNQIPKFADFALAVANLNEKRA